MLESQHGVTQTPVTVRVGSAVFYALTSIMIMWINKIVLTTYRCA